MKLFRRCGALCALALVAVLVPACAPGANPFCVAEMHTVHTLDYSIEDFLDLTGKSDMKYCDTGARGPEEQVIPGALTPARDGTQTLRLRREIQKWGAPFKTWDYDLTLSGADIGDGFTTGTYELGDHDTHSLSWLNRIHYPDDDHERVYESSTGVLQITALEVGPADELGVAEITHFRGYYSVEYPPGDMITEERNTIRIGRL